MAAPLGNRNNPQIAEIGSATRFPKGSTGNAGGRPKKLPFSEAIRVVAEMTISELEISPEDSVALASAKRLASLAISDKPGSTGAFAEMANRAEGLPRRSVEPPYEGPLVVKIVYEDTPTEPVA